MLPVNREDWLTQAAGRITDWYVLNGFDAHYVYASCGWPLSQPFHCMGEIWLANDTLDGKRYVHVNPILSDSATVLGVLAHEIAHTIDERINHSGVFLKAVRKIGLVGPARGSEIGENFYPLANRIIDKLGQYPFKGLIVQSRRKKK